MITAPVSARVHQLAHPPHRRLQPDEHRLADQVVADVELGELRDGGDRLDVVVSQAVPGVRLDAVLGGERGHVGDLLQLDRDLLALGMRVFAGVELDHRRAEPQRGFELALVGGDEQADADAGVEQARDDRRRWLCCPAASSPPSVVRSSRFSGTMQAACGLVAQRDLDHLVGRRHLEVERQVGRLLDARAGRRRGCAGGPRASAR